MGDAKRDPKIAVIGATGLVGGAVMDRLADEGFQLSQIKAVATDDSVGKRVGFGESGVWVEALGSLDFAELDLAIFAVPSDVALEFAEKAMDASCLVIDCSAAYSASDFPVVSVGVNSDDLPQSSLYVVPHPVAFSLSQILSSLVQETYLQRVQVNGLMPVSSLGRASMKDLASQTVSLLSGKPPEGGVLGTQVAFNVIPFGADSGEDSALEELNVIDQARKLMKDDLLPLGVSLVYAPVFFGASCFLDIETAEALDKERVSAVLKKNPWVELSDKNSGPTPVTDAAVSDQILVGKIKTESEDAHRISMWLVVDNVKVAAAKNIVMLSKLLLKHFQ